MASTDSQTVGIPHHPKAHNNTNAEEQKNTVPAAISTDGIKMNDGRKSGETSPVSTWKPTFNRTQSWNQEDQKRQRVLKDLEATEKAVAEGKEKGFSEVTN